MANDENGWKRKRAGEIAAEIQETLAEIEQYKASLLLAESRTPMDEERVHRLKKIILDELNSLRNPLAELDSLGYQLGSGLREKIPKSLLK